MDSSEATTELTTDDLVQELNLRERQIDAVRRVSSALFAHNDPDELLCKTLSVAVEVLGADVGSLQLHDPKTDRLVFRCVLDPQATQLLGSSYPTSEGIGGQVFRSGRSQITRNARGQDGFNPAIDALTGYRTESIITVPMRRFDGPCIGVMQVLNARRPFDESDLAVLETLAAQAATSIESARLAHEAKRAELVNLIGDISHDIKNMLTPLHAGVMTLQTMIDHQIETVDNICRRATPEESWGREINTAMQTLRDNYGWILEGAFEAGERVQSRTREIADTVKGEMTPPCFSEDDLNDLAREVAGALRSVADRAGVLIVEELDPKLPRSEFDHKQMFNALYNLVNNAIPETPNGGSVTMRTCADVGVDGTIDSLYLEVRDTGRGMAEDVKNKLFTDEAISTKPGGTGLGTRIVAGVVARHRGTIDVQSEPGHGSAFIIRLPLKAGTLPLH